MLRHILKAHNHTPILRPDEIEPEPNRQFHVFVYVLYEEPRVNSNTGAGGLSGHNRLGNSPVPVLDSVAQWAVHSADNRKAGGPNPPGVIVPYS